jgi:hypothetical protein
MKIVGEVKNVSGIYLITNNANGKIYVGSSVKIKHRMNTHINHLKKNKHDNRYLQHSWNKYGSEVFSFTVIEIVKDEAKLIEREQFWIDNLKVCDKNIGYNILPIAGSFAGKTQSDDEKLKRRELNTKSFLQFDLEGNLIREWSSISEMNREFNFTVSTISLALKNKSKFQKKYYLIPEDEFTNELLLSVISKKHKKHKGRKVNQYDKNGVLIKTWEAIKHASDLLSIDKKSIDFCCKGIYKQAGGFVWSYAN